MNDRVVVGTRPWLPKLLRDWRWLNDPIPAERLAALRIGVGLVLLADILLTYFPFRFDYFGPGSLAEPDVFAGHFAPPHWGWSLLRWFPAIFTPTVICLVWASAALFMTVGIVPQLAAFVAWAMSLSVNYSNAYLHNSGDLLRQHLLFFLMLTPCGATWSLTNRHRGATAVYPWALRLIFLELVVMYFFNGLYKLAFGSAWQDGSVLHYVLHTPGWARWSPPIDLPFWLTAGVTYFVLAWELLFPALILIKPTRTPALLVGAGFHVATFFNLEIGPFGLYALCMYLPLLPWERIGTLQTNRLNVRTARLLESKETLTCVPA